MLEIHGSFIRKRYDDSSQYEQPVWRCFGHHRRFPSCRQELVEEAVEKGMCDEGYSSEQIDAYFNIAGPAMLTKPMGGKPVAGFKPMQLTIYIIYGTVTEQQRQGFALPADEPGYLFINGFDVCREPQEFSGRTWFVLGISHFDKSNSRFEEFILIMRTKR